jgi:hypothetical protein
MATPPPYSGITGISRAIMKDNSEESLAEYDGNARPGELVVDQTTSIVYVGNALGDLTAVATPGGATTWALLGNKDGASGPVTIALGQNSGFDGQANAAIALGQNAGAGGQSGAAISIGQNAGGNTTQGSVAVAIGSSAGYDAQGDNTVAIGTSAGQTFQGTSATAVGSLAGSTGQGTAAVAIGTGTGETSQGIYSVAVGSLAGRTSQANNSIIINATGANLNQTTANTFTVKPVRAVTSVTFAAPTAGSIPAGFSPMYYNPTTGEIIVITT